MPPLDRPPPARQRPPRRARTGSPHRSAGLALFTEGRRRVLLIHPTSAPWFGTWSIPKGALEPGEGPMEAALRETREEVGIVVDPAWVDPTPHEVPYVDKNGRVRKTVTWFACDVPDGVLPDKLPQAQLQREEVDHASLFDREGAQKRIFARFLPVLETMRAPDE